jgi:hypothetical protein
VFSRDACVRACASACLGIRGRYCILYVYLKQGFRLFDDDDYDDDDNNNNMYEIKAMSINGWIMSRSSSR